MTNYLPLLLGIIGVILILSCYVIIYLGNYISQMQTPKSGGAPELSKPDKASKLTAIMIMMIFICGSYVLLSSTDTVLMIIGTVTVIFASMIAFTTILFAGATINAINSKDNQ
jgi:hypothetical protein